MIRSKLYQTKLCLTWLYLQRQGTKEIHSQCKDRISDRLEVNKEVVNLKLFGLTYLDKQGLLQTGKMDIDLTCGALSSRGNEFGVGTSFNHLCEDLGKACGTKSLFPVPNKVLLPDGDVAFILLFQKHRIFKVELHAKSRIAPNVTRKGLGVM
ncbi:hypothetical protein VNO77_40702 [Canavalia gladiata]|uniref:Uncharacterized protein n=1 Tax=Canavalia gladiata TaxID=3824 RepID=A0AAN9K1P7_CANGL